jgi:LysM repeat protein
MKKLIIILFCLSTLPAISQSLIAFRDAIKDGYNFWFYVPETCDTIKNDTLVINKPLIIFLHGQSLCGSDLYKVRRYGCIDAVERGRKIDAFIIAPQNPGGAWKPSKILKLLNWSKEHYSIDTNKVYVVGMSLGGYGTIDFVGTYPEQVTAAMALCGGGTLSNYCGLTKVPLWIIHGTADKAVPVSQSQKVADAMKNCGDTSLLRFDKLIGVNHSRLARTFYLPMLYEWLFSHSLADSVKYINKNFTITSASFIDVYKDLNRNISKINIIDVNKNRVANTNYENISNYTIQKGDTLSSIAQRYHTSVSQLCKINNIKEDSILQIGQNIELVDAVKTVN